MVLSITPLLAVFCTVAGVNEQWMTTFFRAAYAGTPPDEWSLYFVQSPNQMPDIDAEPTLNVPPFQSGFIGSSPLALAGALRDQCGDACGATPYQFIVTDQDTKNNNDVLFVRIDQAESGMDKLQMKRIIPQLANKLAVAVDIGTTGFDQVQGGSE
ncbi:uncharacterized protein N7483_002872 [Penicillium malachiteum]|uniref:uncharacterized protein n=1 Tax=Penicillium malachiteum TaxID=1324776 RepID=UPI0025485FCA|nr:uncharacterized protein N7483_002872 [Penicillium malachiteum]KAJ5737747.1 hypothetical protein N7483_002872 [Penicillium malachiteum]